MSPPLQQHLELDGEKGGTTCCRFRPSEIDRACVLSEDRALAGSASRWWPWRTRSPGALVDERVETLRARAAHRLALNTACAAQGGVLAGGKSVRAESHTM